MAVSFVEAAQRPPLQKPPTAAAVLAACIFFPGIAAMVLGCLTDMDLMYIAVGAIQLVTIPLFGIGWIWALVWGVLGLLAALKAAKDGKDKPTADVENPPPPQDAPPVPPPAPPAN